MPPGGQVTDGGFALLGDRRVDVAGGEGAAIRINAYGAFCDRKVIEGT